MMHAICATMLDCPVRFNGEYGPTAVETFLNYVNAYKGVKSITDEQCIAEFPFLLEGHARAWFQLRAKKLTSKGFQSMIKMIHSHFGNLIPPFVLYIQLYEPYTIGKQSILQFIQHKLEIFAQLPPPQHADSIKIDMIYGLLPKELQSIMPRNELFNVEDLICKVRKACEPQINRINSGGDNHASWTENKPKSTDVSQTEYSSENITKKQIRNKSAIMCNATTKQLTDYAGKSLMNAPNIIIDVCTVNKHHEKVHKAYDVACSLTGSTVQCNSLVVQGCPWENSMMHNVEDDLNEEQPMFLTTEKQNAAIKIGNDDGVDEQQGALKKEYKFEIDSEIMEQINSIFIDYELSEETSDMSCQPQLQQTERMEQAQTALKATTTMAKTHEATLIEPTKMIRSNNKNKIVKRNLYTSEVEPCTLQFQANKSSIPPAAVMSKEESKHTTAYRQRPARKRKAANQLGKTREHKQHKARVSKDVGMDNRGRALHSERDQRRTHFDACLKLRNRAIAARAQVPQIRRKML